MTDWTTDMSIRRALLITLAMCLIGISGITVGLHFAAFELQKESKR